MDSKTVTNNELVLAAGAGLVDGVVRGGVLGDGTTTTSLHGLSRRKDPIVLVHISNPPRRKDNLSQLQKQQHIEDAAGCD